VWFKSNQIGSSNLFADARKLAENRPKTGEKQRENKPETSAEEHEKDMERPQLDANPISVGPSR
jgi:hypothetical protein